MITSINPSGTPTHAGTYTFTIEATDANNDKGARAYTVVVDSATIAIWLPRRARTRS